MRDAQPIAVTPPMPARRRSDWPHAIRPITTPFTNADRDYQGYRNSHFYAVFVVADGRGTHFICSKVCLELIFYHIVRTTYQIGSSSTCVS
jgi:hypothetical protein